MPTDDDDDDDSPSDPNLEEQDAIEDDDVDKESESSSSSDEEPEREGEPASESEIINQRLMAALDRSAGWEEDGLEVADMAFEFPEDKENWKESDLRELWADRPYLVSGSGWDPAFCTLEQVIQVASALKDCRCSVEGLAPFYLPYRRPYPVVPLDNYNIPDAEAVIEELDRIETFLNWVSYIFKDGSSYEGTVWDDLAHGKGVYVAHQGLVRYEGEWMNNGMDGHGVVEVDIPDIEPLPGSELEKKMRADGHAIKRDFMSQEDREWYEMDIEDTIHYFGHHGVDPFYENEEWVRQYGRKPEKGRYRYAGQWKHARMHGCGVYEVNERTIYGRFYFGELVEEATDCDENISALHAGIAEVAAAKARMFTNKPDGMVREKWGPFNDPQHAYFYEEEDAWMAPGFINHFYEVPDYWKRYVDEVDKEREMWLNSFYKAPLRLPMPSELEYWWDKEKEPEFVVLDIEPEPDPENLSECVYTEDPVILHTPTGRIIDFVEDEEHGIRLFWQPRLEEDEDVDPDEIQLLPLGYDEFFGKETQVVEVQKIWNRLFEATKDAFSPIFENLEKWIEERKKSSEMKIKLLEKELELVQAEISLEEAIEDMDEELRMREKEEPANAQMDLTEEESTSTNLSQAEKPAVTGGDNGEIEVEKVEERREEEEEEDNEEGEEEDGAPSSFGSVYRDEDPIKNDQKGSRPEGSFFPTASLSITSNSRLSAVPSRVEQSFAAWKAKLSQNHSLSCTMAQSDLSKLVSVICYSRTLGGKGRVKAKCQGTRKVHTQRQKNQSNQLSGCLGHPSTCRGKVKRQRLESHAWLHAAPANDLDSILSLHKEIHGLEDVLSQANHFSL